MKHKHSLVLKVILPRWKDDQPGELPEVPSVSGLWSTADWHEREVYDLSGVYFTGHPEPAPHPLPRRLGRPSHCARITRCRWNITAIRGKVD